MSVCKINLTGVSELRTSVTDDIEKFLPIWPARKDATVNLYAAKNEYVSFQILVKGPATVNSITCASGIGPIPASNFWVYREYNMNITSPSGPDGFTGLIPDGLIPDTDEIVGQKRNAFPYSVPSGRVQQFWVDLFVPANASPGSTTGAVRVNFSDGTGDNVTVNLKVWNFSIPSTSSLRSFWKITYPSMIAQHGASASAPDWFRTILGRYAQMGLNHRITVGGFDDGVGDPTAWFQAFGPFVDGTARQDSLLKTPGYGLAAKQTSAWWPWAANRAAVYANAQGRGWLPRTLLDYTCDEPPYQDCAWGDIVPRIDAVHNANSNVKCLVTTDIKQANDHGVANAINILCPVINYMHDKSSGTYPGNQRAQYNSWLTGGTLSRELWLYQSCMSHGCGGTSEYFRGWTTYAIDSLDTNGASTGQRHRNMAWLCWKYKSTGELYYEVCDTYFTVENRPWVNQYDYDGNGDGTLFVPGKVSGGDVPIGGSTDIPCATLRLKHVRNGYQDYEYLKLLEAADAAWITSTVNSLYPDPWTQPNWRTLIDTIVAIGDRLDAGVEPEPTLPPPTINDVNPPNGPLSGGNQVTITGSGFQSGAVVLFGSTPPKSYVGLTTNSIVVTAPDTLPSQQTVSVTVTNPDDQSATRAGAYTFIADTAPEPVANGPSLEINYPVSAQCTNEVRSSLSVLVPPINSPGRLLVAAIIWNTRGNTNALPVSITGLGLTWTLINSAEFATVFPGHEGADIWAAWATDAVAAGQEVTATFGQAVTVDAMLTVYAFSGAVNGAAGVSGCFGIEASAVQPDGTSRAMDLDLNGLGQYSNIIYAAVDGTDSSGLSPNATSYFDFRNNGYVSMAVGRLEENTATAGNYTVGSDETGTLYCLNAVEVKAGPLVVPVLSKIEWKLDWPIWQKTGSSYTLTSAQRKINISGYFPHEGALSVWMEFLPQPFLGEYSLDWTGATYNFVAQPGTGDGKIAVALTVNTNQQFEAHIPPEYYAYHPNYVRLVVFYPVNGNWASNQESMAAVLRYANITGRDFQKGATASCFVAANGGNPGTGAGVYVDCTVTQNTGTYMVVDLSSIQEYLSNTSDPSPIVIRVSNPNDQWGDSTGVNSVISGGQPPAIPTAQQVSAKGVEAAVNLVQRVMRFQHPDDAVVNRIQDSILRSVNPALEVLNNLPVADHGYFRVPVWTDATLTNWWAWAGTPLARPGYVKTPLGEVVLRGALKGGLIGKAAFTLPFGYRPAAPWTEAVATSSGTVATITVGADGTVTPNLAGGTVDPSLVFFLDGISYIPEQ